MSEVMEVVVNQQVGEVHVPTPGEADITVDRGEGIAVQYSRSLVTQDARDSKPAEVRLGSLFHPSLRLREPLLVTSLYERNQVAVRSEDLGLTAEGSDLGAALTSLGRSIADAFLALRSGKQVEGVHVDALQRLVEER